MKRHHFNSPSWRQLTKKQRGVTGIIVLVLALIIYSIASVISWQSMSANSLEVLISARKAASVPVDAVELDYLQTRPKLNKAANKLDKMCKNSVLFNWQESFPVAQDVAERCKKRQEAIVEMDKSSLAIVKFQQDEQTIADELKGLSIEEKTLSEKSWSSVRKNVGKVGEGLSAVELKSATAKPILVEAIEFSVRIDNAWSQVNKANEQQDKNDYINAVDKLDQAYKSNDSLLGARKEAMQKLTSNYNLSLNNIKNTK